MITVERTDNGWIITNDGVFRKKSVFVDRDEMLAAVYRAVCEWDVGDKVTVIKETKEPTPNEQPCEGGRTMERRLSGPGVLPWPKRQPYDAEKAAKLANEKIEAARLKRERKAAKRATKAQP